MRALLGLTVFAILTCVGSSRADVLQVVTAARGPIGPLKLADLRQLFLGRRLFVHGVRIRPLFNKDKEVWSQFRTRLLDMSDDEFELYCLVRICNEGNYAPEFLDRNELLERLEHDPGAIAFLPSGNDPLPSTIKVVFQESTDAR